MEPIKLSLEEYMRKLAQRNAPGAQDNLYTHLGNVLTKNELRHIKLNYFRRGVVGIAVDSSSWLYHLNLKKADLLQHLRKQSQEVRGLRLYLGDFNYGKKQKDK